MENNWESKAEAVFKNEFNLGTKPKGDEIYLSWENLWKATEKCMNLVFEATKKECADNAEIDYHEEGFQLDHVDKESILNINKPNL